MSNDDKEKKNYEEPIIEVFMFDARMSVLTVSSNGTERDNGKTEDDDDSGWNI